MQTERFDTVVIGAGQAGLVTGYHLQRAGRSFVILDGRRARRRRLAPALRLAAALHARLGLLARRVPVPVDGRSLPDEGQFADYLEAYAARFDLPVRTGVRVDGLGATATGTW